MVLPSRLQCPRPGFVTDWPHSRCEECPLSTGQVGSDRSLVGGGSFLRLYGSVDIAMDLVGPNPFQYSIPAQGSRKRWLNPGKPEGERGLLNKTGDFRHLGRTLRVDEVDALAVEHDPIKPAR